VTTPALTGTPARDGAAATKVALVTGGSRGIGAAIVRELSHNGLATAINYRSSHEAAEELARTLPAAVSTFPADVGDPVEAGNLVAGVLACFGRLDVLVLSAGIWRGGKVEDLPVDDWDSVVRTNLSGAFNVTRAAVPHMRKQRFGRIVFIGSAVGLTGYPGDAVYAATKAGLVGLAKSLALETAKDGITVNLVAPGFIETDMTKAVSARSRDRLLARVPMQIPGRVEDVAKAVRYLVEDAPFVTGQVLAVDGGFSG
jgi:3-oxoacyl-[acyl-carrier protein] reductase